MTPAVHLERFKPLDKDGKVDRAAKGQGNPTRIDTTDVESADKPHGLVKKTKSRPLKASGTSTKGTAPNEAPLFTYEEAVRQWSTGQDLLLCEGHDIIPTEKGELPKKSERILKKLRKQAIEARLPELPKGVLPGGWDAFERPWALMDCPAGKVPRVPIVHESSRVMVAVLVSFPPEPFYFVDTIHMDGVIRVSNNDPQGPTGGTECRPDS